MNTKKLAPIILVSALLLSTQTAFAATSKMGPQTPNNPALALTPQQEAAAQAKQNIANAYANKKNKGRQTSKFNNAISPMTTTTYQYHSLGVQPHQENPGYNCGPAATYQDASWRNPGNLYYQSSSDNPNNEPSQYNLSTIEGTTSAGTICSNIPTGLNAASNTGSYYVAANMATYGDMVNDITYDTDNSYPLVADVSTQYLDYYNGVNYLHYISIDGYADQYVNGGYTGTTQAHSVDDNWNNTYYGNHWTSMNGLWNAISYFGTNPNLVW